LINSFKATLISENSLIMVKLTKAILR
jgi:hypothetical protein